MRPTKETRLRQSRSRMACRGKRRNTAPDFPAIADDNDRDETIILVILLVVTFGILVNLIIERFPP